MIDITSDVQHVVGEEDIKNGLAVIYVPHTTAGVTTNEGADPSVQRDIIENLKSYLDKQKKMLVSIKLYECLLMVHMIPRRLSISYIKNK